MMRALSLCGVGVEVWGMGLDGMRDSRTDGNTNRSLSVTHVVQNVRFFQPHHRALGDLSMMLGMDGINGREWVVTGMVWGSGG